MGELVFVRHASTTWSGRRFCGWADPALSRAGQRVATRLATDLATGITPAAMVRGRIVSSPSRRARQTAGAIALAVPGLRVELDERWSEADVGVAEGLTFDELAIVEPDLAERLGRGEVAVDWPGGETSSSLDERVRSALRDLAGGPWPTIVVSHAGPLRIAVALVTGVPIEAVAFLEPGGVACVADGPRR